ncbi:hypothetical protein EDM52_19450 [Brevibacillus invocatus]|uniref:Uncharacterized protein n=1 Tax=Brevibacillus invocatus TaxID=173959 RepID=A0A3M8C0A2_9BACL|nr:hypothetical protein [Brevibacillus invocatus]RNB69021.1 hypothetical protein EDM52_19450 [Brevibacillus invocatus]
MRKGWIICLVACVAMSLGGCGQMGVKQNAGTDFEQIRDHFANQQGYEFYGRTKLLTDNSANANMVNFSGRKDGDTVFMNVKLSVPEKKRVETLTLLDQGTTLYTKKDGAQEWVQSAGDDAALRQEMENWNPAFAFQQMSEMRKNVYPIQDNNVKDDQAMIRVVMDSAKLKGWLASQLQGQSGTHIQSLPSMNRHQPSMKLAMSLTKGDWRQPGEGVSIQSTGKTDVQEIVDQMDLEAEYTILYQKSNKLPIRMTMSIRSQYDYKDQRIQEHSQVETYLQNYGKVKPVPDPKSVPTGKGH